MTLKPVDTAIIMIVGPCIDDTDFKTLEEAIAYNAAGMDISLIIEKTDGTSTTTAITLTTGGTSDWTHKDGGYYEVEITAAQNIEEGIGYLRGVCTGVLPFESPRYDIVVANIYDSWIKGTDKLQIDLTQIGGVVQSLTDFKDMVDTGYDPATHKIQSDLIYIHGTALTETDGQLAAAFKKLFDVATPLLVASDVMVGTDSAALATNENPGMLISTTVSVVDSQTSLRLTSTLGTGDSFKDQIVVIYDASQSNNPSIRICTGYSDPFQQITLDSAPDFTVVVGDIVKIFVANTIAIPTVAEIRTEMEGVGTKLTDVLDDVTGLNGDAMRGTDSANTTTPPTVGAIRTEMEGVGTKLTDVLDDVTGLNGDAMRGTDSANTTTPPTVGAIRTEMDNNSTKMAPSQVLADYKATGFSTHSAADIWAVVTRSLTDKAGFSLSTAGIKSIWDQLTNVLTTVGSVGKLLVDNINATISSRNAIAPNIVIPDIAGTAATLHGITDGKIDVMDAIVDAIKSKTDNLPSGIGKNEALPKFDFLMVLSSDHITAAIGKTVTGEIMKDGNAFMAITNTITEVSNGMYTIANGFTQEEMNADVITLQFSGNACDTRTLTIVTN